MFFALSITFGVRLSQLYLAWQERFNDSGVIYNISPDSLTGVGHYEIGSDQLILVMIL